jgi:proteasome accessory factor B
VADLKTERLINLTLALLSSKRYLQKREIFKIVDGYSGSFESMDRMFERDKSDLRSLGIEIEVGEIDPLFEDEPGYRIRETEYYLNSGLFDSLETSLITLASEIWQNISSSKALQSLSTKLHSFEAPNEMDLLGKVYFNLQGLPNNFDEIVGAIKDCRLISFKYRNGEDERSLAPFRLFIWKGAWYVIGEDQSIKELRTFKIDRIAGEIEVSQKDNFFTRPADFRVIDHLPSSSHEDTAVVQIRKQEANFLRTLGRIIKADDNFDVLEIKFSSRDQLIKTILWHGSSVQVLEPLDLRNEIVERLEGLLNG